MADEADEAFSLKLVGDGISIERAVNKRIAMAIVAAMLSDGVIAAPIERPTALPSHHSNSKAVTSPREFLTESRASSNAEQIAALGHFMCTCEAKESFSKDDLRECFRRAHEGIPKNLPRDVGTAIKAGWIHEAPGNAGLYYVTNSGIERIEAKFGRGA